LELKWNNKTQDFEVKYPLGVNTKNDSLALLGAIDLASIRSMHSRGYRFESLKITLDADESHPHFKAFFPTLSQDKAG
jgi:hypothetical protein